MIDFTDFQKIEMRVGCIKSAEPFPEARKPAYKMQIDFGAPLGLKKTSAQITDLYTAEDLVGKLVIAVTNFPPKQIGKFMSEVLVLGAKDDQGFVTLLQPEAAVPLGTKIA